MARRTDSRRQAAPPAWWGGGPAATQRALPPAASPPADGAPAIPGYLPPPPDPEQFLRQAAGRAAHDASTAPPAQPAAPAGPPPWLHASAPASQYALPWEQEEVGPGSYARDADNSVAPPITPLPRGSWIPAHGDSNGADLYIPGPVAARAASVASGHLAIPEAPSGRAPVDAVRPADFRSSTGPRLNVERSFDAIRPVDPAAAAQLATTFALDYLSWDEDAPVRRSEALRRYLADGVDTTQGWSGRGRQRAEFASPGEIVPVGYGLGVDVHVRVTLYDRVDTTGPAAEAPQPVFALPAGAIWSSAPPPVAPGWVAGPAVWVRLSVPVRRHDSGRLVVDLSPIPEPDNHAEGRTQ